MFIYPSRNQQKDPYTICSQIAYQLKLSIVVDADKFTLQQALDDGEETWFNTNLSITDIPDFIHMCLCHLENISSTRIGNAKYVYKIDCPTCHNVAMTEEQVTANTISHINNDRYIVCMGCGTLIHLES